MALKLRRNWKSVDPFCNRKLGSDFVRFNCIRVSGSNCVIHQTNSNHVWGLSSKKFERFKEIETHKRVHSYRTKEMHLHRIGWLGWAISKNITEIRRELFFRNAWRNDMLVHYKNMHLQCLTQKCLRVWRATANDLWDAVKTNDIIICVLLFFLHSFVLVYIFLLLLFVSFRHRRCCSFLSLRFTVSIGFN